MHKKVIRKCSPSRIPINLELLPIIDLCISKPEIHINNNAECKPTCEKCYCHEHHKHRKHDSHKHKYEHDSHKHKHDSHKHKHSCHKEKHCKHKHPKKHKKSKKKCKCHNEKNLYETSSDSSLVVF